MEGDVRPLHLGIIMDGNGRWATARGLPRTAGHRAGAVTLRRVVEWAAASHEVATLTAFAFSSDNWQRSSEEVGALMGLFGHYLRSERRNCRRQGVHLSVIGRRDRLSASLRDEIAVAERLTAGGGRLTLRIAVDYSARYAILRALETMDTEEPDPEHRLRQCGGIVRPGDVHAEQAPHRSPGIRALRWRADAVVGQRDEAVRGELDARGRLGRLGELQLQRRARRNEY